MINNLLLLIILIPLLGGFCVSKIDGKSNTINVQSVSVWTTGFVLLLTCGLFFKSDTNFASGLFPFFVTELSVFMTAITSFLILICVLVSRDDVTIHVKKFNILILVLESLLFMLFSTTDILAFYILFELVLVVAFLLLGIFTQGSICASKFFIVLSVGALFILFGVVYIIDITGITEITVLSKYAFTSRQENVIFWTFFIGFACKTALFPAHIWLPDAHTEAPTSLSVILSGVLLKIGVFGMITILLPIAKTAAYNFSGIVLLISIITTAYAIISAVLQKDLKRIVAYISVAHMAIITAGIFSGSATGISGAFFNIIAHSVVIPALFIIVHIIENKFQTRNIEISGISTASPLLALIAVIPILSVISTPLFPCFTGEFLILCGLMKAHFYTAIVLCALIMCSVFYGLGTYQKVFFGECKLPKIALSAFELASVLPFVILAIIIGVYPNKILHSTQYIISQTAVFVS